MKLFLWSFLASAALGIADEVTKVMPNRGRKRFLKKLMETLGGQ
jgi:hypothetical protein